jgi:DNA-directed RNA polymerase subunit RPC12/RpoP
MSNLTERANYLKGLADGLQLNQEKSSTRLLLEVIDLLVETAGEIESLQADHEELSDFVDAIDEDLGMLEEDVADLEDSLPPCPPGKGPFGEDEDEPFDGDDSDDEDEVTYCCPHCGEEVTLSIDGFDFDEDMPCPHCGKPLFPDGEDTEEEEAEANETDGEADEAEAEDNPGDPLPGENEE